MRTFFPNLPRFTANVQQQQALGTARPRELKVGPNEPCPCGSGKKFKKCHGAPERANVQAGSSAVIAVAANGVAALPGNGKQQAQRPQTQQQRSNAQQNNQRRKRARR